MANSHLQADQPPSPQVTGVADVIVHVGEPDNSNPYRGHGLIGDERVAALTAFRNNLASVAKYTFWYAPSGGGARRLGSPAEINWVTSEIPVLGEDDCPAGPSLSP